MSKMTNCKSCNADIATSAKICPQCGAKNKKPIYKKAWLWIFVVFIVVVIASSNSDNNNSTVSAPTPTTTSKSAEVVKEVEEEPKVPTEYKSALKKAKTYSDTMHMSKAALFNQLTSEYGEKFSTEAAQYAIDNVNADWKANALAKAKTYQDTMSMSPSKIRDQLTSEYGEKFTAGEADYALANLDK